MSTITFEDSKHLGHLGLVADMIHQLRIVEKIDERIPVRFDKGAKTTHGQRVKAMILNGLGFVDMRLYLFPEFLKNKAAELLFEENFDPELYNDDALGRTLDALSKYGVNKLYTEIAAEIGLENNLVGTSAHLDTTTLQLYGTYETHQDSEHPTPAHGYSKSGRHDLKQMILMLVTTGASRFPLAMEPLSGNASDQKTLPQAAEHLSNFCKDLSSGHAQDLLYVGDAAFYANARQLHALRWLSRVPGTGKAARDMLSRPSASCQWQPVEEGYWQHVQEVTPRKGERKERWALVFSEQGKKRELATLNKKIEKEHTEQKKIWKQLSNQVFACEKDAKKALEKTQASQKLRYHQIVAQITPLVGYAQKGRPAATAARTIKGYQIEAVLQEDAQHLATEREKMGRFILATNDLDRERLPDAHLLCEYKQQSGVERGFRFIKDTTFQVDSVYLKRNDRISALQMVMTLCLMVYGYGEYQVRKSLAAKEETLPN
ncbi:MAG: IS1634 family transposase, partial [Bacteroidota bacterium]